jgi:thymidylate synthase (FAD)
MKDSIIYRTGELIMRIIEPSFEILEDINGSEVLNRIEKCGRVCYKSENNSTEESARKFINMIIKSGHETVLEHEKISVRIICDRGITHEIVRHRIASYSQESTRYCNYSKNKFGNELTFIKPLFWSTDSTEYCIWKDSMQVSEYNYMKIIELGVSPQEARSILPNSLKTEIIATMNLREWRHFFKLRTTNNAHPQMREIAIPLLKEMQQLIPIVFEDILV